MLLIACPYCGERPELEFTYGGEAHLVRPGKPAELSDQQWTDFLYMRTNVKGIYAERWRHARGCGRFFNAVRDTTTDHFLAVYKSGEPPPAAFAAQLAAALGLADPAHKPAANAAPEPAASAAAGPAAGPATHAAPPRATPGAARGDAP